MDFLLHPDMKAVIQRVSQAKVEVAGQMVAEIGHGLLVFAAFARDDDLNRLRRMAHKVIHLRIFERGDKMQDSVIAIGGSVLAVPQFTLLADCRKGHRPSFLDGMPPEQAAPLFDQFVLCLEQGLGQAVQTGRFGADMTISLMNEGPATFILDV